jgi:hypothetical protein
MGIAERPPNPKPNFNPEKLDALFADATSAIKQWQAWIPPFNLAERDQL